MADFQLNDFTDRLHQALQAQQWQKLVLSKYQGDDAALQRVEVRPVQLKSPVLSFLYRYQTRDITKNYSYDEGLALVSTLLSADFKAAHFSSVAADVQLGISKKGKILLSEHKKTDQSGKADLVSHNKEKLRYINQHAAFLQKLGVTDARHQVIPAMSRKWKQINKFIEVFAAALKQTELLKRSPLQVADFGSGKAYLTFALHHYLTEQLNANVDVIGVELRQELVDLCNQTAQQLQLAGIRFEQGDVKHYQQTGLDVMIALHACDTATDYAIHMGIRAGASVILCSPCCHKQIRPQLKSPAVLAPMLKHGIHAGEQAEMLTDSLRALLLEANGYDTQVFEFISLEHTSKNKMILAVKNQGTKASGLVLEQIQQIKSFYGIKEHCLESLLQQS
ncbi:MULTISPECIES: class I SAM-dependent methyltransferase [Rheinheimera]|uniref:Class I SAM-dependent methyltransferase n=1 Tax=Rheinheimera marina TaxID=1774958 RepID=A0ABV9JIA1_9GAMM